MRYVIIPLNKEVITHINRKGDYNMKKENLKIGDVIWVKLHSEGEHIQSGVRPAVIIQNNIGNYFSPTIQVVPLTSKRSKSKLPTHVNIPATVAGLSKDSIAQCEGARPVSKSDILGFIGVMPNSYMEMISKAIIVSTPLIQYLSIESLTVVHNSLVVS